MLGERGRVIKNNQKPSQLCRLWSKALWHFMYWMISWIYVFLLLLLLNCKWFFLLIIIVVIVILISYNWLVHPERLWIFLYNNMLGEHVLIPSLLYCKWSKLLLSVNITVTILYFIMALAFLILLDQGNWVMLCI